MVCHEAPISNAPVRDIIWLELDPTPSASLRARPDPSPTRGGEKAQVFSFPCTREGARGDGSGPADPVNRGDLEAGLRFTHLLASMARNFSQEAAAVVEAVAQLLIERGLFSREEIDQGIEDARVRLADPNAPRVMLTRGEDKYAASNEVVIDCENRLHLCKAKCCTLAFYLSPLDLDEGVAKWDYGRPYLIRKREDGYCVHNDPQTLGCRIHAQRPHVCRAYDCRNDNRIWLDFENRIPAPD